MCTVSRPPSAPDSLPFAPDSAPSTLDFKIIKEEPLYARYRTLRSRTVLHPCSREVSYDILGADGAQSVFIFPVSRTGKVTMLREYCPGPHAVMSGFPAGFVEADKHASPEVAARDELSEEARLTCAELVPLATRVSADKYSVGQVSLIGDAGEGMARLCLTG